MLELHEKSPDSQDSSQGINSLGYSQFHHYSENGIYCQDAVSYYFAQCLFLLFHVNDIISKGISPLTYLFFVTVTLHSTLTLPQVTTIFAIPAFLAVITPVLLTVATLVFLDL